MIDIKSKEYQEFIKFLKKDEDFKGLTVGEQEFCRKMFEFIVDHPFFKKQIRRGVSSKKRMFGLIEKFWRENTEL